MGSIGEVLLRAREERGSTMEDVERAIKIRAKYIAAIEAENFDVMPGDAYVAGFIKTYAEFLGIDPTGLLETYHSEHDSPPLAMPEPIMSTRREHVRLPRPVWVVALAVAAIALVGWFAFNLGTALRSAPLPDRRDNSLVAEPTRTVTKTTAPQRPRRPRRVRPLVLKVASTQDGSWLSAKVDGRGVFDGELPRGRTLTWRARKAIVLRSDTADRFLVYRDGKYLGHLGKSSGLVQRVYRTKRR